MASVYHSNDRQKYIPLHSPPNKSRSLSPRLLPALVFFGLVLFIPTYYTFRSSWSINSASSNPNTPLTSPAAHVHQGSDTKLTELIPDQTIVKGGAIMPKMGNATAKAELGRATWKFMHTMTARFPEKPTPDEREALKAFIYLFSRLYPCGDCARHFQDLLKQYPPQTSSRNAASLHLCSLHNLVNERLGKPEYNCTTLAENYDCGCAHDEPGSKSDEKNRQKTVKEKVDEKHEILGPLRWAPV